MCAPIPIRAEEDGALLAQHKYRELSLKTSSYGGRRDREIVGEHR
jgi:hypothetical protein